MPAWSLAPCAASRRQVRRQFVSISSRLLHRTILDFRLRLVLLAALTLPCILLGGCVHALASGHPWSTSVYLVYGLLFRVPALGAVRPDEPAGSALVLNAVFLFGTFGFAILLGLIGEEVKGTVKALRSGGAPLDLTGHVLILNFTADATAVALLRQLAKDVAKPGSYLYGRPVVVLAAPPPPVRSGTALGSAAGGGAERVGDGGGGGDVEGEMKRVVADALQGRGSCEWHLRVGSSCRTDDLARVCAAAASYIVLLADPRVATSADATAAGAASCMQAQSLMCLSLAMIPGSMGSHTGRPTSGRGGGGGSWRGGAAGLGRGGAATGGGSGSGGGGGRPAWDAARRTRPQATIVVQSPADAPRKVPSTVGALAGKGEGPIATFRAVAAAGGSGRPLTVEVCDRGIVDRLVAQTVLQPGVATVIARLFGGSGCQGTGFRWVEWTGLPPLSQVSAGAPAAATAAPAAGGRGAAVGRALSLFRARASGEGADGGGGISSSAGKGSAEFAATGIRRRRLLTIPRTMSYNASHRSLAAAKGAGPNPRTGGTFVTQTGSVGGDDGSGSGSISCCNSTDATAAVGRPSLLSYAFAAVAALCGSKTTNSTIFETASTDAATAMMPNIAATAIGASLQRRGAGTPADAIGCAASVTYRPKAPSMLAAASSCSRSSSCTTFGEVRAVLEAEGAAADAAVDSDGRFSRRRRQQPLCYTRSPVVSVAGGAATGGGGGSPYTPLGPAPVLVGYMSGATGTLRLNPRDTSPVYPGDQLVLLVSEPGAIRGSPARCRSSCRGGGGSCGDRFVDDAGRCGEGWVLWGRHCGEGATALAAMETREAVWRRNSTAAAAASRLGCCGPETAAATVAALRKAMVTPGSAAALTPLQVWHSDPAEHGGNVVSLTFSSPCSVAAVKADAAAEASGVRQSAMQTATVGDVGSGGGGREDGCGTPGRGKPAPRAPAAPPSHIIVISRTAAAVREVVAGLQEFAPAGSTIALVLHEPSSVRHMNADVIATGGDGSGGSGANPLAPRAMGSSASITAAGSVDAIAAAGAARAAAETAGPGAASSCGNGTATVVLPCPSSSWPVEESDLVVAGLAVATAVLVARDGGLQPDEADATALSVVLQLHQTLTDPTRSPLRRQPRPPPGLHLHLQVQPTQFPDGGGGAAVTALSSAAAAPSCAELLSEARSDSEGVATSSGADAAAAMTAAATTAAAAATAVTGAALLPPAPLHVVVCLHSTRARDTLRSFLAGLNAQPAFTVEALVPEEYRALLLAGVVRQPQSNSIMTDLLSDRPGAPEVYLVPPARLLAAAAAQGLYGGSGGCGSESGPFEQQLDETARAAATDDAGLQFHPRPCCGGALEAGAADAGEAATLVTARPPVQCQAAAAQPCSLLSDWCFWDVASAARLCGCTAIGVLRGGGGGLGGGGSALDGLSMGSGGGGVLQLAPCPDIPLGLSPGDRLVVLAAEPV